MAGAFQADAFQNDAFQTEGGPTPAVAAVGYGPGWPLIFEDALRYRGWSRQKEDEDERKGLLASLIRRVHGTEEEGIPEPIAAELRETTREHIRLEPGRVEVDWASMVQHAEKLSVLLDAYRQAEIDREDEELLLL